MPRTLDGEQVKPQETVPPCLPLCRTGFWQESRRAHPAVPRRAARTESGRVYTSPEVELTPKVNPKESPARPLLVDNRRRQQPCAPFREIQIRLTIPTRSLSRQSWLQIGAPLVSAAKAPIPGPSPFNCPLLNNLCAPLTLCCSFQGIGSALKSPIGHWRAESRPDSPCIEEPFWCYQFTSRRSCSRSPAAPPEQRISQGMQDTITSHRLPQSYSQNLCLALPRVLKGRLVS